MKKTFTHLTLLSLLAIGAGAIAAPTPDGYQPIGDYKPAEIEAAENDGNETAFSQQAEGPRNASGEVLTDNRCGANQPHELRVTDPRTQRADAGAASDSPQTAPKKKAQ